MGPAMGAVHTLAQACPSAQLHRGSQQQPYTLSVVVALARGDGSAAPLHHPHHHRTSAHVRAQVPPTQVPLVRGVRRGRLDHTVCLLQRCNGLYRAAGPGWHQRATALSAPQHDLACVGGGASQARGHEHEHAGMPCSVYSDGQPRLLVFAQADAITRMQAHRRGTTGTPAGAIRPGTSVSARSLGGCWDGLALGGGTEGDRTGPHRPGRASRVSSGPSDWTGAWDCSAARRENGIAAKHGTVSLRRLGDQHSSPQRHGPDCSSRPLGERVLVYALASAGAAFGQGEGSLGGPQGNDNDSGEDGGWQARTQKQQWKQQLAAERGWEEESEFYGRGGMSGSDSEYDSELDGYEESDGDGFGGWQRRRQGQFEDRGGVSGVDDSAAGGTRPGHSVGGAHVAGHSTSRAAAAEATAAAEAEAAWFPAGEVEHTTSATTTIGGVEDSSSSSNSSSRDGSLEGFLAGVAAAGVLWFQRMWLWVGGAARAALAASEVVLLVVVLAVQLSWLMLQARGMGSVAAPAPPVGGVVGGVVGLRAGGSSSSSGGGSGGGMQLAEVTEGFMDAASGAVASAAGGAPLMLLTSPSTTSLPASAATLPPTLLLLCQNALLCLALLCTVLPRVPLVWRALGRSPSSPSSVSSASSPLTSSSFPVESGVVPVPGAFAPGTEGESEMAWWGGEAVDGSHGSQQLLQPAGAVGGYNNGAPSAGYGGNSGSGYGDGYGYGGGADGGGAGAGGGDVREQVRQLEGDLTVTVNMLRALSRHVEKLGVQFRVTRRTLRDPIHQTAEQVEEVSRQVEGLQDSLATTQDDLKELQLILVCLQDQCVRQFELFSTALLRLQQDVKSQAAATVAASAVADAAAVAAAAATSGSERSRGTVAPSPSQQKSHKQYSKFAAQQQQRQQEPSVDQGLSGSHHHRHQHYKQQQQQQQEQGPPGGEAMGAARGASKSMGGSAAASSSSSSSSSAEHTSGSAPAANDSAASNGAANSLPGSHPTPRPDFWAEDLNT